MKIQLVFVETRKPHTIVSHFIMSGIYDTHARIHKSAHFSDSKQCFLLWQTDGYLSVLRDFL